MPETATGRQRRFVYDGMELPEPNASDSPQQVRDFWANTYPALSTARVKGPTPDGDVDVFTFERNVGVKG